MCIYILCIYIYIYKCVNKVYTGSVYIYIYTYVLQVDHYLCKHRRHETKYYIHIICIYGKAYMHIFPWTGITVHVGVPIQRLYLISVYYCQVNSVCISLCLCIYTHMYMYVCM